MLIKKKVMLGSIGLALFILLIAGVVLIDSNKNLTKAIRLINEWSNVESSILQAGVEQKNYFLYKGKKLNESQTSYFENFMSSINKAKDNARRDEKIIGLINNYTVLFEEIVNEGRFDERQIQIKTLHAKEKELQEIISRKLLSIRHNAESTQKKIYLTLLVAFFLAGAVSIGGGVFLSTLITVPIGRLLNNARRISEGDVNYNIEITSQDEFAELTSIFNKINQQLRQEIEKHTKDLEIKINKQTQEIKSQQDQKIQSEKIAAVEQLAAGVSKELSTRLSNIRSLIYKLTEKVSKEDLQILGNLKNIEQEIARIDRVVNNIAVYSKLSVGSFEPFDINKIIEEVLSERTREGLLENIKLVCKLNSNIPKISLDTKQIKQVFDNLFINASQSMPEGGELIVSSDLIYKEVEIKISDSGAGIPGENLGKIFMPFFRTKSEGIGLGLSVVKDIITQHHGSIAVQSNVGKGTTFIIKLPLPR